jgi:hypothetical protein
LLKLAKGEDLLERMNDDVTPINERPQRRQPEAFEDVSLALREHVTWPVADWFLGLSDRGRAAVAGGAVLLALGLAVGGSSLGGSGGSEPVAAPVAVAPEPAPHASPTPRAAEPKPEPTLHGAAPVFKPAPAPEKGQAKVAESEGVESTPPTAATANTGNPATDKISSSPAARPAEAATSSASASPAEVEGPPAGPAAVAVAHKFANAFVAYEVGGTEDTVRKAFSATATPELTKALMRRPPHQPAGVKVPKAKVLNIVPAPSHGQIYPLSVSLLRVGVTSELRLEMEQLKNKGWRVTNVLG